MVSPNSYIPLDDLPAADDVCSVPDEYGNGPVPLGCVADLVTTTLENDYTVNHEALLELTELTTTFQATTSLDYALVYITLCVDKGVPTANLLADVRVNGVILPLALVVEQKSGTVYVGPESVVYTAVVVAPTLLPYINTLQVFVSIVDDTLDVAEIIAPASRVTVFVFQGDS